MKIKIQIKSVFEKLLFEWENENNTIKETVLKAIEDKADLRSADLQECKTDKRYIQITKIGSAGRKTTYCFEDDIIWCECFKGTLDEFEKAVH